MSLSLHQESQHTKTGSSVEELSEEEEPFVDAEDENSAVGNLELGSSLDFTGAFGDIKKPSQISNPHDGESQTLTSTQNSSGDGASP